MKLTMGCGGVSTDDQYLNLQRDVLMQAGCSLIYEEAFSAENAVRPELVQCL
tara:strand:+ start:1091 stop:1246 length:156 start_codon:yes stop_codon:yes gene_type:complete